MFLPRELLQGEDVGVGVSVQLLMTSLSSPPGMLPFPGLGGAFLGAGDGTCQREAWSSCGMAAEAHPALKDRDAPRTGSWR